MRQAKWIGNISSVNLLTALGCCIIFVKATETNKNKLHHLKLVYDAQQVIVP